MTQADDPVGSDDQHSEHGYVVLPRTNLTGRAMAGDLVDIYPLDDALALPIEAPDTEHNEPPTDDVQQDLFDRRHDLRVLLKVSCPCKKRRQLAVVCATPYGPFIYTAAHRRPKEHRLEEEQLPTWGPATPPQGKERNAQIASCSACGQPWLIAFTSTMVWRMPFRRPTYSSRVVP